MNVNITLPSIVLVMVICVNASVIPHDPKYCFSRDTSRQLLRMFSVLTPYDAVRGSAANPSLCKPKKFWSLLRHGSRRPTSNDGRMMFDAESSIRNDIMANYESDRTGLCRSDARNIRTWNLDEEMLRSDGGLSVHGREEMKAIAQSYQAIFPQLLPKKYSPFSFYFGHSPSARTRASAEAFAEGLFGGDGYQAVNYTGGSSPDMLLIPFESCPIWKNEMLPLAVAIGEGFTDGQEFRDVIDQVNEKLGFIVGSKRLNKSDIISLALHCMYEHILNPEKKSPFCAAFSPGNMQVIEYYLDLIQSHSSGFGFRQQNIRGIYRNMNCKLVQDMLEFLQSTDDQKARLHFGHDTTMQFLFVAMGLFEDPVPMTAENFAEQSSREWRTSIQSPMAANFVAVRYKCSSEEDEILFQLNESPLQLPGCAPNGICKISVVLERLEYFAIGNCEERFCTT